MVSITEAYVPGVWAADVLLAEADWVMRVCVGSFESERRAELAANKAAPALAAAGGHPGVVVTVGGQRHLLTAEQVEIMVLTVAARHRLAEDGDASRRALAESDYEPVWDNRGALGRLLERHGEGYAPRRMGVGVRWMPLNPSREDELTEIVATGEKLPVSLRDDLLFGAVSDGAVVHHRKKN